MDEGTRKVYDDIYHYRWNEETTCLCPHPKVIGRFGHDGKCRVSVYTCHACRFVSRRAGMPGVMCGYVTEGSENGGSG